MKIKKRALRAHRKTISQKKIIITTAIVILVAVIYVWHSALMQFLLDQKSIGSGLPVYSVEQTNHTDAYGWFTTYPKLDKPVFDKVVSRYVNNSKGLFLGHVNFDEHGSYPKADLTISYTLTAYTTTTVGVLLMGNEVINDNQTSWARQITYDDTTGRVTDVQASLAEVPSSGVISGGMVPVADSLGPDCSTKKCLALAFAGGPSYVTPQLLDVLEQNHVKATFFELGSQVSRYASAAKQTARGGNVIGNGTYDFRNLMTVSQDEATRQLAASADAIEKVTTVRPAMSLAPYNAVTDELAQSTKQIFIKPTTEENSWQAGSADMLYQSIMADAKPGIIMQSYDTDQMTIDAFKMAIPKLISSGYALVTVPQLLGFDKNTAPGIYRVSE